MKRLLVLVWFFLFGTILTAQQATIREEMVSMKTYMFSDPDPVANIGNIYPYSRFDGFTSIAQDKEWKMLILENDYVEVYVCPDIGGKVWGAIEKSTGKEFLYFNHVVKFRDVAMRGPWTSGGLEFNFGDIGHIPTCATPVDYRTLENKDGSVSCIVGAIDLPSGTKWNIEIKVSPGKAFFETKVSWFNNTEIPHTYYHWMNAAAKSAGNLEFIYPGKNHIGHGGQLGTWPVENGREISWYENNNFGTYKSYHVINSYSDFFGGYWHDDNFGFGHYATYDDKPGKKLWIWGLSDQGMIWEDLLTDNDGQYIEFQAGKLFNQAAYSSTYSPFKHREFQAADADIMHEIWFPVKETGGMVAMSEYAVLNVEYIEGKAKIILSALQELNDEISININGKAITNKISLKPLELFTVEADYSEGDILKVILGDKLLEYSNRYEDNFVNRPVELNSKFNWESIYGRYVKALELEKQRLYNEAYDAYKEVLEIDPGYLPAISRLALAHYRMMEYDKALEFAVEGLAIDTYDPLANYVYGLASRKLGNIADAKSGFSIASHSIEYRAAAYVELSKLFLLEKNYNKAIYYSLKSTGFNANNIAAYETMLIASRMKHDHKGVEKYSKKIIELDPLSQFANYELFLAGELKEDDFTSVISNEFPYESYLDLAMKYLSVGDDISARRVLELSPDYIIVELWKAYLDKDAEKISQIEERSTRNVFPHRSETASILEKLIKENDSWVFKYYLGLIYWNKEREEEAKVLFKDCGDRPGDYWFWLSKARLFDDNATIVEASLQKAYKLEPERWRTGVALSELLIANGESENAVEICRKLVPDNRENAKLGLTYASALYKSGQYVECLAFLEDFELLPYEGSVDGKLMYNEVCVKLAIQSIKKKRYRDAVNYAERAKGWPRNLGVGKPYDVDERLEDFIIAYSNELRGRRANYSDVSNYAKPASMRETSRIIFQLLALEKEGQKSKALDLIKKLADKDTDNIYLKWAIARFNNNPEGSEIERQIISGDSTVKAYDTMFVDKSFEYILETLKNLGL